MNAYELMCCKLVLNYFFYRWHAQFLYSYEKPLWANSFIMLLYTEIDPNHYDNYHYYAFFELDALLFHLLYTMVSSSYAGIHQVHHAPVCRGGRRKGPNPKCRELARSNTRPMLPRLPRKRSNTIRKDNFAHS